LILNHPKRSEYDLSSLRIALTGSASVPPALIEQLRDLGVARVINAYGAIEASVISMTRADDDTDVICTTTGRAVPGQRIVVVGEDGVEVERGTPGEILISGVGLMLRYLDEAQTRAAIIDGWFHSGDVGIMDVAGNVRIVDRRKDMFNVGGFTVYPAEVEGFLVRHPAVMQAAVVGKADARLGEVSCAFIVRRPGSALEADELVAWAREQMANYKVPREVIFLEEMPLNPTGKINKITLRERVREMIQTAND
jgi:acyl-CoA synthetase (AMP-forming)/AMP-acid ligase II